MTEVLIFIGLLLLSAFFSGSETAFFSLSKAQLREIREKSDPVSRRMINLLDRPRELLVSILIGNTVVNTAAASIAAITVQRLAVGWGMNPVVALVLQIVVVTFVLIVAVEISPKVFALRHNYFWAKRCSLSIKVVTLLFWPLTKILGKFADTTSKMLGVKATKVMFTDDELRTLAQVSEEHGVLEEEEREMIHSIFEFGETEVHEIMVPRIDVAAISEEALLTDVEELVRDKGHSRIPVFKNDIDHIVGVLYAKDLLENKINGGDDKKEISDLVRETIFVPENKKISSLLKEFQKDKVHIAIVVDEYGGTEGIVTLEDIIEEIVGEIHDEYDTEEDFCKLLENGDYLVLAKMEVSDFNDMMKEEVIPDDDDYETVAGFILSLAEEVPDKDQKFSHNGWKFTVSSVEENRVLSLIVQPPADMKKL
jgi:magnesium and cobalt exporter, CNNM family